MWQERSRGSPALVHPLGHSLAASALIESAGREKGGDLLDVSAQGPGTIGLSLCPPVPGSRLWTVPDSPDPVEPHCLPLVGVVDNDFQFACWTSLHRSVCPMPS